MRRAICLCLVGAGIFLHSAIAFSQERIEPALESQPVTEPRQDAGAEQSQAEPAQQPTEADRLLPAMNAIESAIRELIPTEDAEERKRQIEREVADLKAQEDLAFWAKCMTWATWVGVAVTAIGLYFIWQNLSAARVTADAAIQANTLNREAFINDQRAWLDIDVVIDSGIIWTASGKTGHISIELRVYNVGKSPAHNVAVRVDYGGQWVLAMADVKSQDARMAQNDLQSEESIFPGREVKYSKPILIPPDFSNCVIAVVYITYNITMDDKRRLTRWQSGIGHKSWSTNQSQILRPSDGDIPMDQLRFYRVRPTLVGD